jgi:tRNA pseudouridine32 synthase/23S rRNA pseudouridine746 synthase
VTRTPLSEAEIQARVLHRDAGMLVIDKPAGIAVHVTGHDAVALDHSFHHLQFGLPRKPELAHRLDRGTSGCLVLGRHRQALIALGKLFEQQKVEKTYRAICHGVPAQAEGRIEKRILKTGQGSRWRMVLDEAGQEAITEYRVLQSAAGYSEILFWPKTGRTHQIRLHAAFALGCPVLGDPFYAHASATPLPFALPKETMLLHAESVTLTVNANKPAITVTAPLPIAMREAKAALGLNS